MELSEMTTFCLSEVSETQWIQKIHDSRWPNGFCCPKCSARRSYTIRTRRLPLYECSACGTQTSLTSGTIMEGSRTPIRLWILAIYLHSKPEGISASRLTRIIGTTYKTAWLICHKIRHAIAHSDQSQLLQGLVRINFAQYGHPYNPTVFRHPQEQPLLIGASMNAAGEFTHIKIKQAVEECSYPQFTCPLDKFPFIRKHVDPQATEIVAVTLKYSKDRNKSLLRICQNASIWINSTFRGIGAKHLQAYLDQYSYGFNMTALRQDAFSSLINLSMTTSALPYPELIRKPNIQPKLRLQYAHYLKNAS